MTRLICVFIGGFGACDIHISTKARVLTQTYSVIKPKLIIPKNKRKVEGEEIEDLT